MTPFRPKPVHFTAAFIYYHSYLPGIFTDNTSQTNTGFLYDQFLYFSTIDFI